MVQITYIINIILFQFYDGANQNENTRNRDGTVKGAEIRFRAI